MFRHERYSCKVDVYAFAFICFEMYEGLYRTEDPAAHAAAAAAPATTFRPDLALLTALGSKRCLEMAALIRRCWEADPRKRPPFSTITAELREIRKLKEYEMPEGVAPTTGRRSIGGGSKRALLAPDVNSKVSGSGGAQPASGGAAEAGCCVVQ